MITIEHILKRIKELAPLNPSASRIAGLVASRESSIDDLVKVIKYDQALTIDVLRYANSALSASVRRIATIKDAVIRIGGARILMQLLAKHVKNSMSTALPAYGYSENELWRHSIAAAVAAENLNSFAKVKIDGLSFTSALLHDVGKLILARIAPREDMERIWQKVVEQQCPCAAAEREILGFSHAEIGAEVITAWKLPDSIVVAVRDHHAVRCTGDILTEATIFANTVARSIGEGIGFEGMGFAVDGLIGVHLGLTKENFERICAETAFRAREIMNMYENGERKKA